MGEQPNFGHHAAYTYGCHVDGWGDGPLLIRYNGREWWFEFSEMFGPTLLRKRDKEPADRQPTHHYDPFWVPFQAWFAGGKKCRAVLSRRGNPRRVLYWVCHVPKPAEGGE